ncbi:MAG: putative LPS assembly protein LptD [Bacteroidota bacterium]|nr:putative LPS assembly protein LptD [Bacteroidota bacterium]
MIHKNNINHLYYKVRIFILSLIFLTAFANNSFAEFAITDNLAEKDSLNKSFLNDEVFYDASDSMQFDIINERVFLYGDAIIKYESTEIKADFIEIDWAKNQIYAKGRIDSSGKLVGNPQFTDAGKTFKAKEMTYNFKSKKGLIKEIVTKEGEGFIHGKKVKKTTSEVMYLKRGEYTTCNAEKPHFSIRANKIKVIPGERIVSGPAYLTVFNIPTPLFLPFGFFPNTAEESSGILIPSYGESANLGFFLKDGGYYFTINKQMDLAIKGDIYTKGSWATRSLFRYKKRYKYNGNLNLRYGRMINSEIDMPDYSIKKDFFIRWHHKQDPKANPSLLFSANVNAGSSTYHKNNSYNANDYLQNTFTSSISLNKKWDDTPFNLSTTLNHNQNTKTKIVSLTLPTVVFNMNRIFPFKSKKIGKAKWYEKIGVSYSANMKNEVSIADSLLFTTDALSRFRNGMRHSIPISTSIKLAKHFTFTPKFNLTERWYLSRIEKSWDGSNVITDTINKFTRAHDYNFSAGLNTKLYGIAQFNKGKIAAFRHVLTPNISFSYRPDFSKESFGYYKSVQTDSIGNRQTYAIMQNGIYGGPGASRSGNINFSLGNLLDMKVRSKKDTSQTLKKLTLIQSMGIGSSYNIFADSLNFSTIALNARTKLLGSLTLTFSSRYDPYINKNGKRINQFEIENGRLARFTSANAALGINISDNTFSKQKEKAEESEEDFYKIPWNLNMNYTIAYNKNNRPSSDVEPIQSLNFTGNIKITKKWKIGFRSGYDFQEKELTYSSIDVYRDLHCWEMLFHWIPIGFHKSYTLTIRVKASVLKDLKLEKKKDWIDMDY